MPLSSKIIKGQRLSALPAREIGLKPAGASIPGQSLDGAEAWQVRHHPGEAGRQAAEALRRAEESAAALLAAARAEADEIREEARRNGFLAGYREGQEAWEEEKKTLLKEAQEVREAARQEREVILRGMEEEVIDLALEIARKVIHTQVRLAPETVLEIAREALSMAPAAPSSTLVASPEDLELLRLNRQELKEELPEGTELYLQAGEGIGRGGCLVKNDCGMVEATVEGQLARLTEALKGVLA